MVRLCVARKEEREAREEKRERAIFADLATESSVRKQMSCLLLYMEIKFKKLREDVEARRGDVWLKLMGPQHIWVHRAAIWKPTFN